MDDIQPLSIGTSGELDVRDVTQALDGLAGAYPADALYHRYCRFAGQAGRVPAHRTPFGREMTARGYPREKHKIYGKQKIVYFIDPSVLARMRSAQVDITSAPTHACEEGAR